MSQRFINKPIWRLQDRRLQDMAPRPVQCSICELGEPFVSEVARQFSIGLPASDVTAYLANKGHKRTQRQLVDHRRHVISPKSPRVFNPLDDMTLEDRARINPRLPMAEDGISDLERESRMVTAFLAATDRMLESLEKTGSIKISRAAVELGSLAHQMLKCRIDRVVPSDPIININVARVRLETTLADQQQYKEHLDNKKTLWADKREQEEPESF